MNHHDVVEASGEWTYPPFSGKIADGKIWGRGTLDTKVTFSSILFAADHLISEGFTPENDIYFAFSGGEEVNGMGAVRIVDWFEEKGITPSVVVDEGGAVVENEGDAIVLALGGSAHGVSVQGDELAAVVDELDGAFLLQGGIIPGVGEGNIHGSSGADIANAQVEGGHAGDNLCVGECTDIAHIGIGDFAGIHQFLQLHAGNNACNVTGLVNLGECVGQVGQTAGSGKACAD